MYSTPNQPAIDFGNDASRDGSAEDKALHRLELAANNGEQGHLDTEDALFTLTKNNHGVYTLWAGDKACELVQYKRGPHGAPRSMATDEISPYL